MKNIIDMTARRQAQMKDKKTENQGEAAVTDITDIRMEAIQAERRTVKRTILTEFISSFVVVPEQGLLKVSIYDISEDGIAFDLPFEAGQFKVGEEVAMRVYLTQKSYFPFITTVSNVREIHNDGIIRHGTTFVKGTVNDEALYHFTKFIETVSADLSQDRGDVLVSTNRR